MKVPWRQMVWQQFGAAIDDLDNAVRACPDELWRDRLWEITGEVTDESPFRFPEFTEFWYSTYPAVFWLDLSPTPFKTVDNYAQRTILKLRSLTWHKGE